MATYQDMRAVLYLRYSSDNQTEQSIEGQRRVCMEYAQRCGYDVTGEYIDRAKSATTDKRPEFLRMIGEAADEKFRYIIVYKLDRFARNRYDSANYKYKLKKHNVRVVSATEHLTDSPESIMLEAVLEANAEYFSAELAQKTKRGMRESALKGKSTGGGVLLGYKIENSRLVIDENTRTIPEIAFKMYAEGVGKQEIADYLNDKGYRKRNGEKFNCKSFKFLRNTKYIGVYHYNDEQGTIEIPGGCPALIDRQMFERVQRRLDMTKKAPAAAGANVDYILSGKLFCGYCGAPMTGMCGHSKSGRIYNYYACHTRRKTNSCNKKNERQDFIEWYICETALQILCGDNIEKIADAISNAFSKYYGVSGVDDLKRKLDTINGKINNIVDVIAETGNRAFIAKLEELQAQQDEITDQLSAAEISARHTPSRNDIIKMLDAMRKMDINNPKHRKHIIDVFVNCVYLYDDKMRIIYNVSGVASDVTFEHIRDWEKSEEDIVNCSPTEMRGAPNSRAVRGFGRLFCT